MIYGKQYGRVPIGGAIEWIDREGLAATLLLERSVRLTSTNLWSAREEVGCKLRAVDVGRVVVRNSGTGQLQLGHRQADDEFLVSYRWRTLSDVCLAQAGYKLREDGSWLRGQEKVTSLGEVWVQAGPDRDVVGRATLWRVSSGDDFRIGVWVEDFPLWLWQPGASRGVLHPERNK
jgi:hypothetical protein